MELDKVLEYASTKQAEYMKDHGTKIKGTGKVTNDSATGISIWETMNTDESVAKAYTPGKQETPMMENGSTESNTDMVSGRELQETVTLVNGFKIKHMVMVFTNGLMETATKVSGSIV